MRVLSVGNMYPPHHLGGYELTWRSAVRHLRGEGHEVRVLTTDFRHPDVGKDVDEDVDVHRQLRWYWRDHDFPKMSPRETLAIERHNHAVLADHINDFRPDVVNWWAMGGMSLSLIESARRAHIPAAGVVGDEWIAYGPRVDRWIRSWRRAGPIAHLAERVVGIPTRVDLGAAARWLFNSEVTRARSLRAGWTLPHETVAHPGVDHSLFRPAPRPPWGGRLVYVGRIDARKGIETAVQALQVLEDCALTVVGSGDDDHLAELQALSSRLGVATRVTFAQLPRVELPQLYARADALVFPTRWEEPWGLVPLEAMACGTPVVATGTGGSAEYLRHGENCLLFSPRDDATQLAGAVRALAADARLRKSLSEEGLTTASRFSEEAYNSGIEAALREAASRGAG